MGGHHGEADLWAETWKRWQRSHVGIWMSQNSKRKGAKMVWSINKEAIVVGADGARGEEQGMRSERWQKQDHAGPCRPR